MNGILEIKKLSLTYTESKQTAVSEINLSLKHREIHALVGQSGCGKSSTIRMIAGLEIPTDGEIIYQGRTLNTPGRAVPPEERNIGMMFQDNALFPHLTVYDNILFGISEKERRTRAYADKYLILTGLEGLGDRYPHEISGGQMQRVALARALAPEPELILMDEPFNNLDIRIKRSMLEEVQKILRETGTTCLFITHDKSEAFILADKITVMQEGKLLQTAAPTELYRNPESSYVAEFFGRANHIHVERRGGDWVSALGNFPVTDIANNSGEQKGVLIHRPWDVVLDAPDGIDVKVTADYFFGDYQEVHFISLGGEVDHPYKFFTHINRSFTPGQILKIGIPTERLVLCKE